jgi:hypothetical protein
VHIFKGTFCEEAFLSRSLANAGKGRGSMSVRWIVRIILLSSLLFSAQRPGQAYAGNDGAGTQGAREL